MSESSVLPHDEAICLWCGHQWRVEEDDDLCPACHSEEARLKSRQIIEGSCIARGFEMNKPELVSSGAVSKATKEPSLIDGARYVCCLGGGEVECEVFRGNDGRVFLRVYTRPWPQGGEEEWAFDASVDDDGYARVIEEKREGEKHHALMVLVSRAQEIYHLYAGGLEDQR